MIENLFNAVKKNAKARQRNSDEDENIYVVNDVNKYSEVLVEQCYYVWHKGHEICIYATFKEITQKCEMIHKEYKLTNDWSVSDVERQLSLLIRNEKLLSDKTLKCRYRWNGRPLPAIQAFVKNSKYQPQPVASGGFNSTPNFTNNEENFDIQFQNVLPAPCREEQKKSISRAQLENKHSVALESNNDEDSCDDSDEDSASQDTVEHMIACIAQNEFTKRWFMSKEMFTTFVNLYEDKIVFDCPKNLDSFERIIRLIKLPKTKHHMFHRKKCAGSYNMYSYYYCFPSQRCEICLQIKDRSVCSR